MTAAYESVENGKISVCQAARVYNVPEQTLRDRFNGVVSSNDCKLGNETLFTMEDERELANHIAFMNNIGYGLTPIQVRTLATNMAVSLKIKNSEDNKLAKSWLKAFLKRWELRIKKPEGLTSNRAESCSEEALGNYFTELEKVMTKYDLLDKPELIYNVDESGFSTEHKPPHIVTNRNGAKVAIISPRSKLTTLLACGNALGNKLPPFLVFSGKRRNMELMNGCLPGSSMAMSDSGWSNKDIFLEFLQTHFLKFVPTSAKVLLLYDGHLSHVTPDVIKLALKHNIILFVLPAHTSHITQPLDIAVFGPMKVFYNQECHQYMQANPGQVVTRYSVCRLICKAFERAMRSENLRAGFRKAGIYPLNKNLIKPSTSPTEAINPTDHSNNEAREFLLKQIPATEVAQPIKIRRLSTFSGRAITEPAITTVSSQVATTSRPQKSKKTQPLPASSTIDVDTQDTQDSYDEEEMCCVCKASSPPGLTDYLKTVGIFIVNWAQCDTCTHWVHLKFCSEVRVVRKNTPFLCVHCQPEQ